MNALTGFQVLAIDGLQNNAGLTPPNVSALQSEYESFDTVNNFITIFNAAPNAAITQSNKTLLQNIGANSFPYIFGAVPFSVSNNIGIGYLVNKATNHIKTLFGNVASPSIFVQALTLAQAYAVQSADTLNSAASATWNGSPVNAISGGVSAIAGNDPANITTVAGAFSQMGRLTQFKDINAGFSAAYIFKTMLEAGDETIGNLHVNFFGKTIIDPTTGQTYIVNLDLLRSIVNDPSAPAGSVFAVVALNPLELQLQALADKALTQTQDLDAVITYIGVNGSAAASINQFSDCLNPQLMLGTEASSIICQNLGVDSITAWNFLQALVQNISGINNIPDFTALATLFNSTQPLGNLNLISQMTSPVSSTVLGNLKVQLGPGSGVNGNPTVTDVMGSTNVAGMLTDTITEINQLQSQTAFANISTDSGNVANILVNGWPGNANLSNGNTYTDANVFCSDAANLINQNANTLFAFSIANNLTFTQYDLLATTQNNSVVLMPKAGINISSIQNNVSSLISFAADLGNMPSMDDEITGLTNVISPLMDSTVHGQALTACIIEAKNNNVFNHFGIANS